jgi:hypothetical protein
MVFEKVSEPEDIVAPWRDAFRAGAADSEGGEHSVIISGVAVS